MSSATQSEINRALYGKGYKPEHALQNTILQYLALEKVWAIRLNTSTMIVEDAHGKKRPVKSHSGGKGVADILALPESFCGECLGIIPFWIEVKAPEGKQTPEQKSFQLDVVQRGHRYLVAYSIEDVVKELKRIRA